MKDPIITALERMRAAQILAKRAAAQFGGLKQRNTDDYAEALVDMLCDQLEQGEIAIKQHLASRIDRRIGCAAEEAAKLANECDKAAWQSAQLKTGGQG